MTDIIERLRQVSGFKSGLDKLLEEAAAEIARLRGLLEKVGRASAKVERECQVEVERLRTAAEDALGTLEAIELLDASRFGLKTEAVKMSCDKLHAALEQKP